MANEKYLNRYRISSARAPWHGYSGGIYFITICTAHRKHFFGKISGGEMHLSVMGKCLDETIRHVTIHYPNAEIPLFVIMPDHFHAIVIIDGDKTPKPTEPTNGGDNGDTGINGDHGDQLNHVYTGDARCCRDVACRVSTNDPTNANVVPNGSANANGARDVSTPMGKNLKMQGIANQCGWLSVCMGGIKSAVTKFAHAHHIEFAWQTRFHDHIIRDTGELDRIALYIKKNITQWESDRS